ncbi:MAG: FG-GAP-like repeat-containing protein [Candidatus Muirbacterium halophilum]|nr:FG-GAP-like repeat-containing protein [Candidatus Muirbacterium halophilum]MCK9476181.1 FG-GAP-like repeat-containing protein [Candidatus Muirbacterium halophilum]
MKKIICSIFLLNLLLIAFSHSGFTVDIAGSESDCQPLVYDLDDDGQLEFVVAFNNGLLKLYENDGTEILNVFWARHLSGPAQEKVAIFPGENEKQIIVTTYNGKVYSIDVTGEKTEGWEEEIDINGINSKNFILSAPEIDAENNKIFFTSQVGKVYVVDKKKNYLWQYQTDGPVSSSVIYEDIDGDGIPEIIFKSDNGTVYVFNSDYKMLSGWPVTVKENYYSMPYPINVADINNDGNKEIVFPTNKFKDKYYVYIMGNDGNIISKIETDSKIYKKIELNDIDSDGVKDLVYSDVEGKLFIKNIQGKNIKGWPVNELKKIKGKPYLIDIDGDGKAEVVVVGTSDGLNYYIRAYTSDGKRVGDEYLIGNLSDILDFNCFYLGDADDDGYLDAVFVNDGKLQLIPTSYFTPVKLKIMGVEYEY